MSECILHDFRLFSSLCRACRDIEGRTGQPADRASIGPAWRQLARRRTSLLLPGRHSGSDGYITVISGTGQGCLTVQFAVVTCQIVTYPLVNNSVVRGLERRYRQIALHYKEEAPRLGHQVAFTCRYVCGCVSMCVFVYIVYMCSLLTASLVEIATLRAG